ncbi:hypothetical protein G6F50_017692 [Rhizopus delemar]|uniref:Uncharacterized protein n=1 Tax=Rhizopus delemar TaxID=936053 RepID=A0A9P6XPX2_9FUNG|nr:hypothetical protein G6F50_017692 [Rhizopus delemar]
MLVGHTAVVTQHDQHRRDRCAIALRCIASAVDGDREAQIVPAGVAGQFIVGRKAHADQFTGACLGRHCVPIAQAQCSDNVVPAPCTVLPRKVADRCRRCPRPCCAPCCSPLPSACR